MLKRSLNLRSGQSVIIETWPHTLPVAQIVAREARRLGIRPVIFFQPEHLSLRARARTNPANENAISRAELAATSECDGYIAFPASPIELRRWDRLPDAHRRSLEQRWHSWNRALARHSVPAVYLLAAGATKSSARYYGVPFDAWRRESLRATAVDPRLLRREARPLVERLVQGRRISISHPNGTHLELGLIGRPPRVDYGVVDPKVLSDGSVWTTLPAGSLVVALDGRVAEGRFVSNRPSRHRRGVISGVTWTFRGGRLVHHRIEQGRRLFEDSYRSAGRERDHPSLLWVGLNPEIRDFPLAEDQERGVIALGLGHNDDFGGRTRGTYREYALLRGAELFVDDRPVLRKSHRP